MTMQTVGQILAGMGSKNLLARLTLRAEQRELFEIVKTNSPKRWQATRDIYRLQRKLLGHEYQAYPVDWCAIFTPIELQCWDCIRTLGGLPFCPQYPVERFFVDFGDPVRKFAIECDGKAWHDAKRDAARDEILQDVGWRVFRVTGHQCHLPDEHPQSVYAVVRELAETHYGRRYAPLETDDELGNA